MNLLHKVNLVKYVRLSATGDHEEDPNPPYFMYTYIYTLRDQIHSVASLCHIYILFGSFN